MHMARMRDHLPGVYGHVEATWRTQEPPQPVIDTALAISCPDCNVNVFIREDDEIDRLYHNTVAHDATCPWLLEHERGAT